MAVTIDWFSVNAICVHGKMMYREHLTKTAGKLKN